jgi:hypothetical protein
MVPLTLALSHQGRGGLSGYFLTKGKKIDLPNLMQGTFNKEVTN